MTYYLLQTNWVTSLKGVHYAVVKIITNIPSYINDTFGNIKRFKIILNHFLIIHSGGILYWVTHLVDDSISIFLQIL
jgi:hypothetical protein